MPSKFLDETGLSYFWGKLKTKFASLDANGKVSASQTSSTPTLINNSKTLEASDMGKLLLVYSSSAVTITIPHHSTTDLRDSGEVEIVKWGSGNVSIAPASSVGLWASGFSSSGTRTISVENGVAVLKYIQTNTNENDNWLITGDLS